MIYLVISSIVAYIAETMFLFDIVCACLIIALVVQNVAALVNYHAWEAHLENYFLIEDVILVDDGHSIRCVALSCAQFFRHLF